MPNTTVYPFGPDGQIPSGYPIADDLFTNSAQQALSAKQGVVLNKMVGETYVERVPIDISAYSMFLGNYINKSSNQWKTSAATQSFFVPIEGGAKYRVTANSSWECRVAILKSRTDTVDTTPDYATGETAMHEFPAGTEFEFTAPLDATCVSINSTLSGNSVLPASMFLIAERKDLTDKKITGQPLNVIVHTYIDARTSSADFGKAVSATNDDWAATEFLDTCDAKFVRVYIPTFSTSNNYYGKAGVVFYDVDRQPINDGAKLIKQGPVSVEEWCELAVPDGAKYVRLSVFSSYNGTYRFLPFNRAGYAFGKAPKPYYGEKISFEQPGYWIKQYASNSVVGQSSAIYGKYLFIVKNKLSQVILYDIENRTVIYTLTTGVTPEDTWHCNQSSFSTKKYDADDMFPVLYISMQNNQSGRAELHGFRIVPVIADDVITSFSISLVQTIYLPVMTDENCLGNPNAAFDTVNGFMWTYSKNQREGADNYGVATFTKFAIPELAESSVTLEDSDILESFQDDWDIVNAQGGCIVGGKLVIMQGYASVGYICVRVIDLYAKKKQVSYIDLYADGFLEEPEGVFWYDGFVHTSVNGTGIYRLILE